MSGLYVYVGAKADIDLVARDLRNQAPIVIIMCCSDENATARMTAALSEKAVGKQARGDRGWGRTKR